MAPSFGVRLSLAYCSINASLSFLLAAAAKVGVFGAVAISLLLLLLALAATVVLFDESAVVARAVPSISPLAVLPLFGVRSNCIIMARGVRQSLADEPASPGYEEASEDDNAEWCERDELLNEESEGECSCVLYVEFLSHRSNPVPPPYPDKCD